jgi:hypothetical protein
VLTEPARAQNEYFRKQAGREHDFPHYGLRKVSVSTMKAWLRMYRKGGFEALKPKSRADSGRPRRLGQQTLKAIEVKCKAYPYWTVQKLYENLQDQGLLALPPRGDDGQAVQASWVEHAYGEVFRRDSRQVRVFV